METRVKVPIALLLFCIICRADWSQFRGPNGSGISLTARPPVDFGPGKNVRWKTLLPPGHSSPVIHGNKIFVTAVEDSGKLLTICLNRDTGKIVWQKEAPRPRQENFQRTNSAASPTPVTDGKDVFVFFGDFGLIGYSIDGKELWKLPLGPFNNPNGHGSSPILFEKSVVLLCDQDTNSYLLAVDRSSGRIQWKTERPDVTRSFDACRVSPREGRRADRARVVPAGSYEGRSGSRGGLAAYRGNQNRRR
ncbi:MAG: PQQ-binding-like beta-propeller repeat protein [Bryobacteraceae bacterium]